MPLPSGTSLRKIAYNEKKYANYRAPDADEIIRLRDGVAAALAEELSDEQHDISGAYVYTGDVQEVSMMSENTNDNLNDEEIAVSGVAMEVDR